MKSKTYKQSECNWKYNASCCADTDCFPDCKMPCPYDKEQAPCDMCKIICNEDVKLDCIALKIYTDKQSEITMRKIKCDICNKLSLADKVFTHEGVNYCFNCSGDLIYRFAEKGRLFLDHNNMEETGVKVYF